MTNSDLFKKAHAMTAEVVANFTAAVRELTSVTNVEVLDDAEINEQDKTDLNITPRELLSLVGNCVQQRYVALVEHNAVLTDALAQQERKISTLWKKEYTLKGAQRAKVEALATLFNIEVTRLLKASKKFSNTRFNTNNDK